MTINAATAQKPQRQHVVPKMHVRNFATADGIVHAYNKIEERHFKATPNNIFVQKDRYTQHRIENENERHEVERNLAEIESRAAPVIAKIVGCRKTGQFPSLAEEEGDAVKLFLITMFLRTDHHANEIIPFDRYEQMFRQQFAKQGDLHELTGDERRKWKNSEVAQRRPG